MLLGDLRDALLECVRARVRNGELTERGLARLTGVSQPHMHNLLKGTRVLSPEIGDRILYHLRLSALDLIDRPTLRRHLVSEKSDDLSSHSYLPVLVGRIGPSHPWPCSVESYERFPIPMHLISRMFHPIVVRAAEDVRMYPLFGDGDLLLLDQSRQARTEIDPDAIYVIKRGRIGLVRRLRNFGRGVYMVSDDSLDRPNGWERLPVEGQQMTHFVRARAQFISRDLEWPE
jgi:hypothetical protein